MRVLVTRPTFDAWATAEDLKALGVTPVLAPMLMIRPLPDVEIDTAGVDAVLLTSRNAVRMLGMRGALAALAGLPAFAVGDATADAARAAGFADVRSAGGTAADLVQLVMASLPAGSVLLNAGAVDRACDVGGALRQAGHAVRDVALYRADPVETLPEAVAADIAGGGIDAVLVASARTAASFRDALGRAGIAGRLAALTVIAISEAAAAPLAAAGRIAVAPTPDRAGLNAAAMAERDRLAGGLRGEQRG